jgi:ribose-phosphate pyrophosphokinase
MKIISGTTSETIAEDISKSLKIPIIDRTIKRFPDGELYIRILENIKDENILLIQNTFPDKNIIELFLLQDALREANVNKIITIIPYFGYARQDKIFQKGEVISAKTLASLISINADEIITIDPHKEHILDFFSIPAYSISAINDLSYYFKNKNIDLILAPDKGAIDRVKKAAEIIKCDYDYMEKKRINEYKIQIKPKNLDVENKKIAIIDDIISTGGTMAKSIYELKKQKAKKVYVACTHGLFVGDAIHKLNSAKCDEIVTSDTILNKFSKIKIVNTISRFLKLKKYIMTR